MRVFVVAALLALGGCAKLHVEIDVLDPSYVAAATGDSQLVKTAYALQRGDHGEVAALAERLTSFKVEERTACYEGWIAFASQQEELATSGLQKALWANERAKLIEVRDESPVLSGEVARYRKEQLDILLAIDAKALPIEFVDRPLTGQAGGSDREDRRQFTIGVERLSFATRQALGKRRIEIDNHVRYRAGAGRVCHIRYPAGATAPNQIVDGKVKPFVQFPPQPVNAAFETRQASLSRRYADVVAQTLIGGGALLHDRDEAFYVTSAEDGFWAKRYNRALGQGEFGSTDVVLKLNDTGAFTVKGFVFDVRSTADMVKKVGTSALSVIAAAYGAPVSISSTTATAPTSKPTFDANKAVAASETTLAVEEARNAAYEKGLRASADAILALFPRLEANDAAAKKAAKDVFTARKDAWKKTLPTESAK